MKMAVKKEIPVLRNTHYDEWENKILDVERVREGENNDIRGNDIGTVRKIGNKN